MATRKPPTLLDLAARVLRQAKGRPRTTRELARRADVRVETMTTTLRRAETRGLVKRAEAPRTCTVTGKRATGWLLAA